MCPGWVPGPCVWFWDMVVVVEVVEVVENGDNTASPCFSRLTPRHRRALPRRRRHVKDAVFLAAFGICLVILRTLLTYATPGPAIFPLAFPVNHHLPHNAHRSQRLFQNENSLSFIFRINMSNGIVNGTGLEGQFGEWQS